MLNIFSRFILWLKKIFHILTEPLKAPPERETPEVSAKKKIQKPYKKKLPTEKREKEREKPSEGEKKPATLKQRREVDLGNIGRKKPESTKKPKHIEKTEKESKRKEITIRIESPFVEIDLNRAKVFLIIPKQQFKCGTTSHIPQQLQYELELNSEKHITSIKVSEDEQGIIKVEEERIELKEPLENFKVVFPDEIQGRTYNYKHDDETLYAFIAIGNDRGRMHYLYDEKRNINPLPKKDVWLLLKEDFELNTEPDIIEERWVWENYQPLCVNLKETNELIMKYSQTDEEKKIPCEMSFSVEGKEVVEDDFKEQSPLFVGKSIKIRSPRENPTGWMVWIQNKQAGHRIIDHVWTGVDPLELKLTDDLPCECGEFQVDICEKDDRIPMETLFFRYIPSLHMEFPRNLIIPSLNTGHKQEIIQILLERDFQDWELMLDEKVRRRFIENGYQIELLPEQDILRFSLMKKSKPETEVNLKITIPRLKWRTSKNKTWYDKPLQIKRDELIVGTDFYLTVCTNNFDTKYDLSAILETNGQKLQEEEKFIRKGIVYSLLLNRFYETIQKNNDKITLRVGIRKEKNKRLLNQVDVIHLPGIIKEKLRDKPQKQPGLFKLQKKKKDIKNMRPNVRGGRGMRKGKGFSRQEIIKANIDIDDIRRLHITFDKRRKSAYSENVETLKSLIGGE